MNYSVTYINHFVIGIRALDALRLEAAVHLSISVNMSSSITSCGLDIRNVSSNNQTNADPRKINLSAQ